MPWVDLQFVIVLFPDHAHSLFFSFPLVETLDPWLQTAQMPRLIEVFDGRTCQLAPFAGRRLNNGTCQ